MSVTRFRFPFVEMPEAAIALREEVRQFLNEERENGGFVPMADCWASAMSPEYSRKVGQRGWLGMTWEKKYGGDVARDYYEAEDRYGARLWVYCDRTSGEWYVHGVFA